MAERYPEDFDGIFARVPVINWTGLQHAGMRDGLATMGEGWMDRAQVELVSNAVLAQCGGVDGIVDDPVDCRTKFDPAKLACAPGATGDNCLNQAQIDAIRTLHSPYDFPFALANGVTEYPGWGVSGEANPSFGPTGGWRAWWLGSIAADLAAVTDQRHRLDLRFRGNTIHLRPRSDLRSAQISP